MPGSPLQQLIQASVTNGLGYDSRTNFSDTPSLYTQHISADEKLLDKVKNSPEGLEAHLYHLGRAASLLEKGREVIGTIYSAHGREMHLVRPKRRDIFYQSNRETNLKIKAVVATGIKLGGRSWLMKKIIDSAITEYILGPLFEKKIPTLLAVPLESSNYHDEE